MATQGTAQPAPGSTMTGPPAEHAGAPRGRYRVVGDGDDRALLCGNASNVTLRVVPGLTVNRQTRRRYPPRAIFLDGVFGGAPFINNHAQHYSLDHHAGCVRGFTLATCEQAVVMLLQGLPLGAGDWNVYVNDPDLDSVLAAWVLMNHQELLSAGKTPLRAMMPLIRLEGVIDAHGTDMELLSGFPEALHADTRQRITQLMKRERELKGAGKWFQTDWIEYTREMLEALDRMAYSPDMMAELSAIQEAGRVSLGQRMALLMRSTEGIYALESRLKVRYGSLLGLLVLDQGGGRFTLRQVDTFLKRDLTAVYKALNKVDPSARTDGDPPNVWGGSGNIGGAPRATGSGLTGEEILAVVGQVLGPTVPLGRKLWRLTERAAMGLVSGIWTLVRRGAGGLVRSIRERRSAGELGSGVAGELGPGPSHSSGASPAVPEGPGPGPSAPPSAGPGAPGAPSAGPGAPPPESGAS